jgi:hypothetical protein
MASTRDINVVLYFEKANKTRLFTDRNAQKPDCLQTVTHPFLETGWFLYKKHPVNVLEKIQTVNRLSGNVGI